MSTITKQHSKVQRKVFGASLPRQILAEIDRVRGDTNRSLWFQRLALKELERLKNLEKSTIASGVAANNKE
jgi:hypothetical protein